MFPLFMLDGVNIDKLLRAQIAFILFAGAGPPVIRGGLRRRRAASTTPPMRWAFFWKEADHPAAGDAVIPPPVNTFIAFFKDAASSDHRHLRLR